MVGVFRHWGRCNPDADIDIESDWQVRIFWKVLII